MQDTTIEAISRLRDQAFDAVTTVSREVATDRESAELLDCLQHIAYDIGRLERAA